MKLPVLIFTCFFTSAALAVTSLSIGNIYTLDLRQLVESNTFETISSHIQYDINLDGRDEVMLGITCGNAGCDYYIFDKISKSEFRYLGNIFFHPKAITIDPNSRIIKTYVRSSASKGCVIDYLLNNKGFKELRKKCN